jgi:hypothetical protein
MGGRASRRKGHDWEREVVRIFREIFPAQAKKISRVLVQNRDGAEAPDVAGAPYFWIEAKHHVQVSIQGALHQADTARKALRQRGAGAPYFDEAGKLPLVVAKDTHRPPVVAMYLSDFRKLLRSLAEIPEVPREPYPTNVPQHPGCPSPSLDFLRYPPDRKSGT